MTEQRYQAVPSVIKDGRTVTETSAAVRVSRQTLPAWLAMYEAGGLEWLVDGSHRPLTSRQQMPARVEPRNRTTSTPFPHTFGLSGHTTRI